MKTLLQKYHYFPVNTPCQRTSNPQKNPQKIYMTFIQKDVAKIYRVDNQRLVKLEFTPLNFPIIQGRGGGYKRDGLYLNVKNEK